MAKEDTIKSGTAIRKCNTCGTWGHTQDKLHGYGNRVFNLKKGGMRCTVCGKEVGKEAQT